MPIISRLDPGLRLLEVRIFGDFTLADLRAFNSRLFEDPAFGPDLRMLVLLEGMVSRLATADLVEYQEWRRGQKPPVAKMAIVAVTDHEFGTARQFEMATGAIGAEELRVFRRIPEARAWLGLPDPE